jgi:hypothetical protein
MKKAKKGFAKQVFSSVSAIQFCLQSKLAAEAARLRASGLTENFVPDFKIHRRVESQLGGSP